jgi:hypothetical protein
MNLSFLHAQQLVNQLANCEKIDAPIYFFGEHSLDCLIVESSIVDDLMKSTDIVPFDIWNYYLDILKKEPNDLKRLSEYFSRGPLLKDSQDHHEVRRRMAKSYQKIEAQLEHWDPPKINELSLDNSSDSWKLLVNIYCNNFFSYMVGSYLNNESPWDIPHQPIFKTFPNVNDLNLANQILEVIFQKASLDADFVKEEFWILSSILIMGNDALRSALHYALDQNIIPCDSATNTITKWYEEIAPVSLVVRTVVHDFTLDQYQFRRGANIYYCPYLTHLTAKNLERGGHAFGRGPHLCPGRGIAIKAAAIFFDCYKQLLTAFDSHNLKGTNRIWRRRLVLEQLNVER